MPGVAQEITPGRLPAVTRTFGPLTLPRGLLELSGRIIRAELLGNGLWPVDTGRSLRAFRIRVRGQRVLVRNSINYSEYVEENTGAVARSVRLAVPDVVRAVRLWASTQGRSAELADVEAAVADRLDRGRAAARAAGREREQFLPRHARF